MKKFSIKELIALSSMEAHLVLLVRELIHSGANYKEISIDGVVPKLEWEFPDEQSEKEWAPVVDKIDKLGTELLDIENSKN